MGGGICVVFGISWKKRNTSILGTKDSKSFLYLGDLALAFRHTVPDPHVKKKPCLCLPCCLQLIRPRLKSLVMRQTRCSKHLTSTLQIIKEVKC